jgi:monovalent cation:H+ antiporter-2, CPA2 family
VVASGSRAIGQSLQELSFDGVMVTALVRRGQRHLEPSVETQIEADDVLVLFGSPDDLHQAESRLTG